MWPTGAKCLLMCNQSETGRGLCGVGGGGGGLVAEHVLSAVGHEIDPNQRTHSAVSRPASVSHLA